MVGGGGRGGVYLTGTILMEGDAVPNRIPTPLLLTEKGAWVHNG